MSAHAQAHVPQRPTPTTPLFFRVTLSNIQCAKSCLLQLGSLKRITISSSKDAAQTQRQFVVVAPENEVLRTKLTVIGVRRNGGSPTVDSKQIMLASLVDIAKRSKRGSQKIRCPKFQLSFAISCEQLVDVGVHIVRASVTCGPCVLSYRLDSDFFFSTPKKKHREGRRVSTAVGRAWDDLAELRAMLTLSELRTTSIDFQLESADGEVIAQSRVQLRTGIDDDANSSDKGKIWKLSGVVGGFLDVSLRLWPLPTWVNTLAKQQPQGLLEEEKEIFGEGKMTLRISRTFRLAPLTVRTLRGRSGKRDVTADPSKLFYRAALKEQSQLSATFGEELFSKALRCVSTIDGVDQTTFRFLSIALQVPKERARELQKDAVRHANPEYIIAELKSQLSFIDSWVRSFKRTQDFEHFKKREVSRVNAELKKLGIPIFRTDGRAREVPSVVGLFDQSVREDREEDLKILDEALQQFRKKQGASSEQPTVTYEYRTLLRLLLLTDAQNSAAMASENMSDDIPSHFVPPSVVTQHVLDAFLRRYGATVQVYAECCWLEVLSLCFTHERMESIVFHLGRIRAVKEGSLVYWEKDLLECTSELLRLQLKNTGTHFVEVFGTDIQRFRSFCSLCSMIDLPAEEFLGAASRHHYVTLCCMSPGDTLLDLANTIESCSCNLTEILETYGSVLPRLDMRMALGAPLLAEAVDEVSCRLQQFTPGTGAQIFAPYRALKSLTQNVLLASGDGGTLPLSLDPLLAWVHELHPMFSEWTLSAVKLDDFSFINNATVSTSCVDILKMIHDAYSFLPYVPIQDLQPVCAAMDELISSTIQLYVDLCIRRQSNDASYLLSKLKQKIIGEWHPFDRNLLVSLSNFERIGNSLISLGCMHAADIIKAGKGTIVNTLSAALGKQLNLPADALGNESKLAVKLGDLEACLHSQLKLVVAFVHGLPRRVLLSSLWTHGILSFLESIAVPSWMPLTPSRTEMLGRVLDKLIDFLHADGQGLRLVYLQRTSNYLRSIMELNTSPTQELIEMYRQLATMCNPEIQKAQIDDGNPIAAVQLNAAHVKSMIASRKLVDKDARMFLKSVM